MAKCDFNESFLIDFDPGRIQLMLKPLIVCILFSHFAYTAPQANNFWIVYIVLKLTTQFLFQFLTVNVLYLWSLFFLPMFAIMCLVCEFIFLWSKKKVSRVWKKISYQWNVSFDVRIKECCNRPFFFFTQFVSMQCFLWHWKKYLIKKFD